MSLESSKKSDLYEKILMGESMEPEQFSFIPVRPSGSGFKFSSQIPDPAGEVVEDPSRHRFSYDPQVS